MIKEKNDVRRAIGLVFQETTLDDYLTAEQNILFHALAYGVPSEVRKQRTKELLTLMELWERRKSKIRTYSGGMKRRLEIARGLVHLPRVLFLDEPTLGLDPQTRNRIWEYILDLREKQGLTIFLTTHYMDEAEHSDRIAVIDHGKIVALDTPNILKDQVGGDVLTISSDNNDLVEVADALGDMLYILCGTIIEHGMQHKIEQVFTEIQRSNMSKLGADGKPIYREDGKVLKGPNYFRPDIKKILENKGA